jgi:hypothetical protein
VTQSLSLTQVSEILSSSCNTGTTAPILHDLLMHALQRSIPSFLHTWSLPTVTTFLLPRTRASTTLSLPSAESQKGRRKKFAKRYKVNAKLAKAGRIDKRDIERMIRAFGTPAPLYLYNPACVGCVAATGNVVTEKKK